jgi:hypothetical protein
MISPSDIEYSLTKKIKQGELSLVFPFNSIADWIMENYGVRPINIIFDVLPHDNRPRLQVIFETKLEHGLFVSNNGLFPDKSIAEHILSRFKEMVVNSPDFKTDNIFLVFSSFEKVAKEEVNSLIPISDIDSIKNKVDYDIWEIKKNFQSATIFFYTDKQVENYTNDEVSKKKLKDLYFDLLKKYDEFDYLNCDDFDINFDSKENFDNNYESNWFYYSRG